MFELTKRFKDRKGIAIIWVAIGLASILGFAVLALDLSAIQTARTQLQNAADAAVLAAAPELVPNGPSLQERRQNATQLAISFAGMNRALLNEAVGPVVISGGDVTFPQDNQVTVKTHRTVATGDPVKTYFIQLIPPFGNGLADVTADATAEVLPAGGTRGFFPWALPDRYEDWDGNGRWDDPDPYTDTNGNGQWDTGEPYTDANKDGVYTPGDFYDPVLTGYQTPADAGALLEVKQGDPQMSLVPGFYFPVRFPPINYYTGENPQSGGSIYNEWIVNKSSYLVKIGDVLRVESGNMQGPTSHGIDDIFQACPTSYYDQVDKQVKGHSHPETVPCPRIGAIAFFDPSNIQGSSDKYVTVVKLSHWFIESQGNPQNTVYGRLIEIVDPEAVPGPPSGGFIYLVRLIE
jgi:Flp pilus assembly protein TadG